MQLWWRLVKGEILLTVSKHHVSLGTTLVNLKRRLVRQTGEDIIETFDVEAAEA